MRLSHSQVQEWPDPFNENSAGCQMKWAFNHVYHAPQAPGEAPILGDGLHAALEADGRHKLSSNNTSALSLSELVLIARAKIDERLKQEDPDGLLTHRRTNMLIRVESMLKAYVQHVQRRYVPSAEPEGEFHGVQIGGVSFAGKIDARTERAILDWKTASALVDKRGVEWIDKPEHADQAMSYMIATGEGMVRFIVFACSPDDPQTCNVKTYTLNRADLDLATYEKEVSAVASGITQAKEDGRFLAHCSPLCAWCGYQGVCEAGRAWVANSRYSPAVPLVRHSVTCDCGASTPVSGYRYDREAKRGMWQSTCEACGLKFERAAKSPRREKAAAK